jgi:hypothetical protein
MNDAENLYKNTIIYKITCKDPSIVDMYVGHTINFIQRKRAHKQCCNNINSGIKLYTFIREHGGWSNWNMDIVNFFNCKDQHEARQKEQEYFISLSATLNSVEPVPTPKKDIVNISNCKTHADTVNVENTDTGNVENTDTVNDENTDITDNKTNNKFSCDICKFSSCNKKDYKRHLLTRKHVTKNTKPETPTIYTCSICNKTYRHSSSLCKHKKVCTTKVCTPKVEVHEKNDLNELVIELVRSTHEIQRQIIELCRNTINN